MRVTDAAAYGFSPKQSPSWQRFSYMRIVDPQIYMRVTDIYICRWKQLVVQLAALLPPYYYTLYMCPHTPPTASRPRGGIFLIFFIFFLLAARRAAGCAAGAGGAAAARCCPAPAGLRGWHLPPPLPRRSRQVCRWHSRSPGARGAPRRHAALLLLYCCFTAALLLLYCCIHMTRGAPRRFTSRGA